MTSREDLESAVQAVDDSAEGYIRVEDVMDDRDTLSEMVEATCSEGEWSLSFYDEGAKVLDVDSPEDVVEVLWQFATADKAFLGRDWSAGYQAAPFEVETDEHELIPIQEGAVEEVL
ncbi:hypothetical protein [Corynebacterium heidelbergense]|uniref:Uncharacterized protein n=1 Tax=Corynebacterium heidelbergense TaxID=2055947 RepID=A0A364V7I3_9CORY|nr:hypothetical protein [Corynebacterium heidelbergense]RAV32597.1 hypothetical protein DLJ54_02510 [Corynebacterium heidelbergense]